MPTLPVNNLLIFFFFIFSTSLSAAPLDLEHDINEALKVFQVPGLAIGIIKEDQVLLAKGYGMRNVEDHLPVTENTLFAIGSCTKAFTAFLLGQLVDEGKMEWDDPVIRHLPQFQLIDPYLTEHVTIRDILCHRVGIARQDELWENPLFAHSDVLPSLCNLKCEHGFREKFLYNNLLYATAGILTGTIRGQAWEEVLTERIFFPLEMTKSNASLEKTLKSADFALPYHTLSGKVTAVPFRDISSIAAAGNIYSNASDMLQWIKLQLSDGSSLIKKETLQEMHFIQIPTPSAFNEEVYGLGYGLGFGVASYRGHYCLSHQGKIDGFTARVSLIPSKKIGIIVLTNSTSGGPFAAKSISQIALDHLLEAPPIDWLEQSKAQYELKRD